MLFWLKKFITFWLMPLPFCLTVIAMGLWLTCSTRRLRRGRILIAAGVALLLVFSNNWASTWLLRPLESRYPAMPEFHPGQPAPEALARCRFVVILGGGHADTNLLPASSKLSFSSLGRIVEGVRLLRELPGAVLIVSGPAAGNNPTHASVLAAAAVSLGVDPERIRQIDTARDTEDESRAVKAMVGDAPVALVTSAWHMPRAAADFQAAGVDALPCPADFQARSADHFEWTGLAWDTESLGRSTAAIHERLGELWMRLHR